MKRVILAVAAAGLVSATAGCYGFRGGVYVPVAPVVQTVGAVAVTAAIVGTAVALTTAHDAHMHWDQCGCQRQWHEGHWVYWYGGWWEYYDQGAGAWYHY